MATLEKTSSIVQSSSRNCRLDSVLDESTIRVGGRLHKSAHWWNHMLSELRRKYWIVKGNSVARKVLSRCVVCRCVKGKTSEQKMEDLPQKRILQDLSPFSMAYFSPIEVSEEEVP